MSSGRTNMISNPEGRGEIRILRMCDLFVFLKEGDGEGGGTSWIYDLTLLTSIRCPEL